MTCTAEHPVARRGGRLTIILSSSTHHRRLDGTRSLCLAPRRSYSTSVPGCVSGSSSACFCSCSLPLHATGGPLVRLQLHACCREERSTPGHARHAARPAGGVAGKRKCVAPTALLALPHGRLNPLGLAIAQRLLASATLRNSRRVGVYVSCERLQEVNTFSVLCHLLTRGTSDRSTDALSMALSTCSQRRRWAPGFVLRAPGWRSSTRDASPTHWCAVPCAWTRLHACTETPFPALSDKTRLASWCRTAWAFWSLQRQQQAVSPAKMVRGSGRTLPQLCHIRLLF